MKSCDTNGDLVADTKEVIKDGFGRLGNIEHSANGLFWGMDNTINVSEHSYNVLPGTMVRSRSCPIWCAASGA